MASVDENKSVLTAQRPPSNWSWRDDRRGVRLFHFAFHFAPLRANRALQLLRDFLQVFPIPECWIAFVVKRSRLHEICVAMKKPTNKLSVQSAFSLVELLVVIAVIAVIAAIAIPNIANITQSADQATKLRNAQSLAMTYNNYAEAYYAVNNAYPTTADVAAAVALMGNGTSVTNNRLGVTNSFRLPGITTDNTATNKLTLTGSQLVFSPGTN